MSADSTRKQLLPANLENVIVIQVIKPGEVNWMTAGSGIAHSERTPRELRQGSALFGIQSWVALPRRIRKA